MKQDNHKFTVYHAFSVHGFHFLPVCSVDWDSSWISRQITIGWIFWTLIIEWPIE